MTPGDDIKAAGRAPYHAPDAPDEDCPTVHLRCGSDIANTLVQAGFCGRLVEFADPCCQGPVVRDDDGAFMRRRATFLAAAYGLDHGEVLARLRREQAALHDIDAAERVVLWFEHDSYDQLILARVLAHLRDARPVDGADVELICVDSFPGVERFRGLGQLGPSELRSLWAHRRRVDADVLELGALVWDALRSPDPSELVRIAATGTPAVPPMARAVWRHLEELPWTGDGLSLTERLVLGSLTGCARRGAELFDTVQERDPLPFLGDLMFFSILGALASGPAAAITASPADAPWSERDVTLTALGARLVSGDADWIASARPDRWIGAVRISAGAAPWRWCPERRQPVPGG